MIRLFHKSIDQISEHAERLREAVAQASFRLRDKDRPETLETAKASRARKGKLKSGDSSVSVTISIGLAEPGMEPTTPEEILKAADQALYRAKEAGRNRVST